MENNERDRKLDQWLDEALSEYSAAEPRFGLEQRVLNRVRGEETRSRKRNVWRWMPAFAAIAAVMVVAVVIRPVMEKKVPERQLKPPIDTYTRSTGDSAKSSDATSMPQKTEAVAKPPAQPELGDTLRKARAAQKTRIFVPQKENDAQADDRDRLTARQAPQMDNQLRATRSLEKKEPASSNVTSADGSVAVLSPPPPPPPPLQQVQPGGVGGVVAGAVANAPATAKAAPVNVNGVSPKASVETAGVPAAPTILLNDKTATESVASVIVKDTRRKEAHTKPDAPRQDANVVEVYGVRVRFDNGPATQQFPTPVPLSNQEKLALKAGQQLKDSAVAQHKSTEITPIEIKDVEIKPLEGPEKEK